MEHSFSTKDRFEIAEAALKLREPILTSLPKVLAEIETGSKVWNLEDVAENLKQHVQNRYGYNVFTKPFVDRGEQALERHWESFRGEVPLKAYEVGKFNEFARDYQSTMEAYRHRFPELIDEPVITGAGFGFLASKIIMDSLGQRPLSPKALAAISLLHPITDNALDRGIKLGNSMQKITGELKGEKQTPENDYERIVFELIHDIQSEFPLNEHPDLHEYLRGLHAGQLESAVAQRSDKTPDDALIELASRKGGFTALALAYISKGKLSPEQEKFFFQSGVIFQLGDDLLDVKEDIKDGTQTIWTRVRAQRAGMKAALSKFLALQRSLEASASLAATDPEGEALARDLKLGLKFYLLSAYLNGDAGPHFDRLVEHKFPLTPENARAVAFSIYRAIQLQSDQMSPDLKNAFETYRRVFDRHFLQDQVAKFDVEKPGDPRQTWKIYSQHPLFLMVRAAHAIQDFLRRANPVGSVREDPKTVWPVTAALLYLGAASVASDRMVAVPLFLGAVPLMAWKRTRTVFTLLAPVAATANLFGQLNDFEFKSLIPIVATPYLLTPTKGNSPAVLAGLSILVSSLYIAQTLSGQNGEDERKKKEKKRRLEEQLGSDKLD